MTEITCCAECKFVGKEEYHGSNIWCEHPKAMGVSLPNRDTEINPRCPISTFAIVRHVEGEYDRNIKEYLLIRGVNI